MIVRHFARLCPNNRAFITFILCASCACAVFAERTDSISEPWDSLELPSVLTNAARCLIALSNLPQSVNQKDLELWSIIYNFRTNAVIGSVNESFSVRFIHVPDAEADQQEVIKRLFVDVDFTKMFGGGWSHVVTLVSSPVCALERREKSISGTSIHSQVDEATAISVDVADIDFSEIVAAAIHRLILRYPDISSDNLVLNSVLIERSYLLQSKEIGKKFSVTFWVRDSIQSAQTDMNIVIQREEVVLSVLSPKIGDQSYHFVRSMSRDSIRVK